VDAAAAAETPENRLCMDIIDFYPRSTQITIEAVWEVIKMKKFTILPSYRY